MWQHLPNHLQIRTLAHTHTHTCSIDPAIVGTTGERLLSKSSGVRPSHFMPSMVAKRVPLRPIFRVGNSRKSLGARSGEYGGWVMIGMLFSARKRRDKWQGEWFLYHDNAPSHTSLVCSISSPKKTFLSSPSHRTLRISLRVTFGCFLLWKWASRGRVSQPWRTWNRIRRPNSGRFQKKPSAGASNNGRIVEASVCVCAQGTYFEGD